MRLSALAGTFRCPRTRKGKRSAEKRTAWPECEEPIRAKSKMAHCSRASKEQSCLPHPSSPYCILLLFLLSFPFGSSRALSANSRYYKRKPGNEVAHSIAESCLCPFHSTPLSPSLSSLFTSPLSSISLSLSVPSHIDN